jgi:hypothetical protein
VADKKSIFLYRVRAVLFALRAVVNGVHVEGAKHLVVKASLLTNRLIGLVQLQSLDGPAETLNTQGDNVKVFRFFYLHTALFFSL